ncbi:MAG: BatD family protein, partial [Limisphaerales bacterium]
TQGSRSREQIGNHTYTVIPLSFTLTAIKTGALNVGPVTASAVIVVPSSNQQQDPFFRQFGFGGFGGEQKQISLATDPQTIQSLPLPTENVPPNFNGAVGHYTMTVTAGPTNLAVGDPITVRVKISGRGAFDSLALPGQPAWKNFKIFPPTSKVETTDRLGIQGSKTFEEIVTPENTDVHELPPFSFSYFDPNQKTYRTLTQPSVQLAVHSGGAVVAPTIAATRAGAENPPAQQYILPVKQQIGSLAAAGAPLVTRPAFLALQAVPVLAFLAAFVWRKRTENLANNPRLRRKRAVEKLIQNGLNDLRKFAAENNSEEFFAMLFHLLQEQLGERLDCPASAITENVIEQNSILRGVPDNLPNELRELFQLCNQARYAPIRGSGELNSVAAKFEKVIQELQNVKA